MIREVVIRVFKDMARLCRGRERAVSVCVQLSKILQEELGRGGRDQPDPLSSGEAWGAWEFLADFEKLLAAFAEEHIQAAETAENSPAINKAVSYIKANYKKDITLEQCAAEAGLSYTHLSRLFSREMGCGFSEYLNRLRIGEAKIHLVENTIPIKEIVDLAGFRNYNYFFKVFKEMEGITPYEYIAGINRRKS
jgi:AraC-like DNA-binding protein